MCNEHKSKYAWYELEQQLLKCWEVVHDLHLISETANDGSDYTTLLAGMAELYDHKFEKAWELYEAALDENYSLRNQIKENGNGSGEE